MTLQNTTTFSSVGDVLKEKIIKVDETCPIHNCKKVVAFNQQPICQQCIREEINQRNEKLTQETKDMFEKRKTYSWLKHKSILVDDTLKVASFDSYLTDDVETKQNKEKALQIAREYYKGANFNTIFSGKPGTGKSHLAMAMVDVVNENSKPYRKCLFISLDELMRRIKDSFNNNQSQYTEQNMVDMLIQADILVLDDLGAETGAISSDRTASDFTVKILYAIINGRMRKPTIITTNLSSKEITKMYDAKLVSRMYRGTEGHRIIFKETQDKRLMDIGAY